MLCAKVLFSCLKTKLGFHSVFEKHLDGVFRLKRDKVKLHSTLSTMTDILEPPNVNGMKVLDRNAFKKTVSVPSLLVDCKSLTKVIKVIKKFLTKILELKSVENLGDKKRVLLNPQLIQSWENLDDVKDELEQLNVRENDFSKITVELGYENWSADALISAVLPKGTPPLKSFSLIGHIIHLNVKEELLDYRHIIAEILLDKVKIAKTVICKKNFISNVYRNFEIEHLCGEPNYIASVCESGCRFELDFSKVYWNPRLGTEHSRVTETLTQNDVLFDVFAGIGPFAIPAAKKKCFVFANDLNPDCIKWLTHNISLNKKAKDYITCFNKDGGDFILNDVKENLMKFWTNEYFTGKILVVMNLPYSAPTFMKYFKGLFSRKDLESVDVDKIKKCLPIINCYFFTHGDECGKSAFEKQSDMSLNEVKHSLHFVRKVSNSGSMLKIVFPLPFEYLTKGSETVERDDEPLPKRICTK